MAHALTDDNTVFPAVTVPDDGDTRNAASLSGGSGTGFQALANRTANLKRYIVPTAGTNNLWQPMLAMADATGWTNAGNSILAMSGSASSGQPPLFCGVTVPPYFGATLSTVICYFIVKGPHTSLPASAPTMDVTRYQVSTQTRVSMSSTGAVSCPLPGTASAWDNGGNVRAFTFTCNQNNVWVPQSYAYYITLVDEHGSGSVSGNEYLGFELNYT